MTSVHHHHHPDPWLLVACVVGALALIASWYWFLALLDTSVGRIFAGVIVR